LIYPSPHIPRDVVHNTVGVCTNNVTVCAESVVIKLIHNGTAFAGAQTHRFDDYYQLRSTSL
jgi:hypothetical protein